MNFNEFKETCLLVRQGYVAANRSPILLTPPRGLASTKVERSSKQATEIDEESKNQLRQKQEPICRQCKLFTERVCRPEIFSGSMQFVGLRFTAILIDTGIVPQ